MLTGEGRFDATSGTGKVVGELLRLAARHGVEVGIIAGQVSAAPANVWTAALVDLADSIEDAIEHPEPLLRQAGAAAAAHFSAGHLREWASKNA